MLCTVTGQQSPSFQLQHNTYQHVNIVVIIVTCDGMLEISFSSIPAIVHMCWQEQYWRWRQSCCQWLVLAVDPTH